MDLRSGLDLRWEPASGLVLERTEPAISNESIPM